MKKLLGIIVLGLLWFIPVSADHDDTKAWEVDGEYLTPKCFLYEWNSSDNFKEFYKKYATEKTRYRSPEWIKWWSNVGLYYGKEIPLEDSFEDSFGNTLSLTRYLKDCTSSKPIIKEWTTEREEILLSYRISAEVPKKYCEIFAPNIKAKCIDLKVISLVRQFATVSMRPVDYLYVYGIFELENNDKIILILKEIFGYEDYKKFIASISN